jgi:hypothetical protein
VDSLKNRMATRNVCGFIEKHSGYYTLFGMSVDSLKTCGYYTLFGMSVDSLKNSGYYTLLGMSVDSLKNRMATIFCSQCLWIH